MQDNFDLKGYLRHGNKLLNEGIGGKMTELEKPENIYADDNTEGSYDNTDRMMDLGGNEIEKDIMFLLDDGFDPEDILEMCKMFIDAHSQAAAQGQKF